MKNRIWELDAFRGLCILGMVAVHFVYDLTQMYGILQWQPPAWFSLIQNWGNLFFLLISGICVTLGRRCVKRGLIVFGCGMLCTLVTYGMYRWFHFEKSIIIYFGVLHCLGVCMVLWALFKWLPTWLLTIVATALTTVGLWVKFSPPVVDHPYLIWLGILYPGFGSSDYFPLLPYLGFFLLGAVLGRLVYKEKKSLLPQVNPKNPLVATLLFFGKHSLLIYLLHQPILTAVCMLIGG